jgi:hypothetical protein
MSAGSTGVVSGAGTGIGRAVAAMKAVLNGWIKA